MYEWSPTVTDGQPTVSPSDMAAVASWGVQTIYLQSGRMSGEANVLDPDTFRAFLDSAHGAGMKVVAWVLPSHTNEQRDLARFTALSDFAVDGIVVDVESGEFGDVTERNARAIRLGAAIRAAFPTLGLGAAVFSPVALDRHEPETWPNFPWQQVLAPYDVVLPMSYWTIYANEQPSSDDAVAYTRESLAQLRALIRPGMPIHNIGGVLNEEDPDQIDGMVQGMTDQPVIGVSLYSWSDASSDTFAPLAGFRR